MKRKQFLTGILGAAIYMSMDGFSTLANAITAEEGQEPEIDEFATYGAVHLNVTDLKKTIQFWTKVVGMKLRSTQEKEAQLGTNKKTLIVIHETANSSFKKGYSGLYHVAIHAPNEAEFASMVNRVMIQKYPASPVDHTMSKSLYLDDPDGINIEFTLETPERFKRVVTKGGLKIEDVDGNIKSASDYLDLKEVMTHLKDQDTSKIISSETYIGHLHLYANDVSKSKKFYDSIGFIPFNDLPQFMYADLGMGGEYQHRIALNSWHGQNRPLAPAGSAGMKHFQINYKSEAKLTEALKAMDHYEKKDGGYWVVDPTGNHLFLTTSNENVEEIDDALVDLEYLIRKPIKSDSKAPVLLLLHGYGSNEKDLFSFAPKIRENWLVISVRAPFEMTKDQYKWYDVKLVDEKITANLDNEKSSRESILHLIDKVVAENNGDPEKIVASGFSQGANMALNLFLTDSDVVSAAACFSGRLMEEIKPEIKNKEKLNAKKVFIAHGAEDNMLPIKYAEESKAYLETLEVQVQFSKYQIGHSISNTEINDFSKWLQTL